MAATVPVKQDSRGVWYSRIYLGKDSKGKKIQAYRQPARQMLESLRRSGHRT